MGPHSETAAMALITNQLTLMNPARYDRLSLSVPYVHLPRQRCDLCIGSSPNWEWAVEVKLFRLLGDNGQPNDNMLMHLLSPYPIHRSALSDCSKLVASGLHGRKAILIYAFENASMSIDPAIDAFEHLAEFAVRLGKRNVSHFYNLIHPIHSSGRVFAWEVE
jgi:hypothetical protein